jgi:hypothetical protein
VLQCFSCVSSSGWCRSFNLDLKQIFFKKKFCPAAQRLEIHFFTQGKWQTPAEPAKLPHRKEYLMHIRTFLAAGLMLVQACASAQTAGAPQKTDAPSSLTLKEAQAQRTRAKALKAGADKAYAADRKACQKQAIAIGCMSAAKERRSELTRQADVLEREARAVELEARRREVEAKAAKREAAAPVREAKQQTDAERYRESEAKRAAERERRRAEEPEKLESRRAKVAAEQAARERKVEKQQKLDAKRAADAEDRARKKAEGERQHEERVRKIEERKQNYAEKLKRREAKQAKQQAAQARQATAEAAGKPVK